MKAPRPVILGFIVAAGLALVSCGRTDDKVDIGSVSNDQDLIKAGRKIFFAKGQCAVCHTLQAGERGKCPDLEGAGGRLTREFIYETLTQPNAYIRLDFDADEPRPYPARMPVINKPPIGLAEPELLAVTSFIQSQGGAVTVSPSELKMEEKRS